MRTGSFLSGLAWLLAGFEGRIGRAAFWAGSALVALALLGLGELALQLGPGLAPPFLAFAGTFALYPWSALAAKRAIDRGRPALYGVVLVLGIVLPGLAAEALVDPWSQALGLASAVLWLAALVDLGLLPAAAIAPAHEGCYTGTMTPTDSPAPPSPTDPVALTQALVRCPSVTPAEGGALALLAALLTAEGFSVERPVFAEPGTPAVENLYARIGSTAPVFVIAGHTDVVPVGDAAAWTRDPFGGEIVDGVLYGRGACDMKGGLAAMICAALRFRRENPDAPGSIAILVTGDEEGPAVNGTVKLLQWAHARGERFDHCLLGEPTNPATMGDMIKIGRRGSLTGRLTVNGTQGHVGYPHLADNPIRGMVRLLAALDATPLDGGTAHFGRSNLEVTTLDVGNPASNVVPAQAKAVFNIRFNDIWTPETLAAEIERRLREAAGNAVRYELVFEPTNSVAFLTEPGPFVAMVADAVEAETGHRPALSTTGGTSDARFIKSYCPVVEYGVVGQTMHKVDEHAAVADIVALERITHRILTRYFCSAASA